MSNHRIIFGVIVTAPVGEFIPYRSPILAWPFAETVFDHRQPQGLDITVSIEGEPKKSAVSGNFELVYGTVQSFENAIAAIKPAPKVTKPDEQKGPLPSSFIQLGIGSPEFCQVFVRFWQKSIGNRAYIWSHNLLDEISTSKRNDFIWVDVHSGLCKREEGARIMMQNIASMVA